MLKWLSVITLLALAAGVAAGAWVAASGNAGVIGFAGQVQHVGDLWLNLLRMTVIPLVFSLLVTGVASVADAASSGRLAVATGSPPGADPLRCARSPPGPRASSM